MRDSERLYYEVREKLLKRHFKIGEVLLFFIVCIR